MTDLESSTEWTSDSTWPSRSSRSGSVPSRPVPSCDPSSSSCPPESPCRSSRQASPTVVARPGRSLRSCPSTRIVLTYLRERGIELATPLPSDQRWLQGAVEQGSARRCATARPHAGQDRLRSSRAGRAGPPGLLIWRPACSASGGPDVLDVACEISARSPRDSARRGQEAEPGLAVETRPIVDKSVDPNPPRRPSSLTTYATEFTVADCNAKGG